MYDYLNNSVRRYFAGKREPLRAALEGLNFLVVTAPSFAYFSLAVPLRHRNGGPILDNDSENIMYGLLSVLAVFALCLASARWGVVCSPGFEANVMMTTVFNAMVLMPWAPQAAFIQYTYAFLSIPATAKVWNWVLYLTGLECRTYGKQITITLGELDAAFEGLDQFLGASDKADEIGDVEN